MAGAGRVPCRTGDRTRGGSGNVARLRGPWRWAAGFRPAALFISPGEAARAVKWLVEHSLIDTAAAGSAVVCYSDPDLP